MPGNITSSRNIGNSTFLILSWQHQVPIAHDNIWYGSPWQHPIDSIPVPNVASGAECLPPLLLPPPVQALFNFNLLLRVSSLVKKLSSRETRRPTGKILGKSKIRWFLMERFLHSDLDNFYQLNFGYICCKSLIFAFHTIDSFNQFLQIWYAPLLLHFFHFQQTCCAFIYVYDERYSHAKFSQQKNTSLQGKPNSTCWYVSVG